MTTTSKANIKETYCKINQKQFLLMTTNQYFMKPSDFWETLARLLASHSWHRHGRDLMPDHGAHPRARQPSSFTLGIFKQSEISTDKSVGKCTLVQHFHAREKLGFV